jgi:CubicO group peptidase (beta-lactamase class C family)
MAFATQEQMNTAKQASAPLPATPNPALAWPEQTPHLENLDQNRLNTAIELAFNETETQREKKINTRALLVHYDGQLIAERYADGFDKNTPLRGMSMTKSVTSAQIGILVQQGKLDISQPANIKAWQHIDDPRSKITVDEMLRMVSVFDYSEGYEDSPLSDVNSVLFESPDMAAAASQFKLKGKPDEDWAYQTLNPVLLAKVIRNTFDDDEEYYRFAREQLFNKLGMYHSYLQADASGTFAGGAFMYASARDWVRFGLLYLNQGQFNGEQILPPAWADYTNTASAASLKKQAYGAQFWLNAKGANQWMPSVPEDAYAARGHNGQMTLIIPSKKLVIVRLGMSFDKEAWNPEPIVAQIIASLPPASG